MRFYCSSVVLARLFKYKLFQPIQSYPLTNHASPYSVFTHLIKH